MAIVTRLRRNAGWRAGLADRGHAGADRQLAGDEVGAARRAARLGVVVGEQHAFGGELVEVRRPPGHHAAVVGADVPDADVVAHDDDDVRPLSRRRLWLLRLRRCRNACSCQRGRGQQRGAAQQQIAPFQSSVAWRDAVLGLSTHLVLAHDAIPFCSILAMHLKPTWLVEVSTGSAWRAAGR